MIFRNVSKSVSLSPSIAFPMALSVVGGVTGGSEKRSTSYYGVGIGRRERVSWIWGVFVCL